MLALLLRGRCLIKNTSIFKFMHFSKGWAGKRQIFCNARVGPVGLMAPFLIRNTFLMASGSTCRWGLSPVGGSPPPLKAVQVVGTTVRYSGHEGNICQWSADGVLAVHVPFTCQVDPVTRDRCLESPEVLGARSWSTTQIKALT